MFRKIMIIALCLALLAVTACAPKAPVSEPTASPEPTAAAQTPAASEDAPTQAPTSSPEATGEPLNMALVSDLLLQTESFSVGLLQNLKNAYTEENTLFSPLAFNAAMAALYAAADGDTEEEIRTLMGYKTEPADVVETTAYLLSAIDPEHFTVGNSLHVTKRVKFSEEWLADVAAPLQLDAQTQDFSDAATFAAINSIAGKAVGDETLELLPSTAAADTLYLVSAASLHASFDTPFALNSVKEGKFEATTGLTNARMMHGDLTAGYAEDEYMQLVSLPMNEGALQLKLILPHDGGERAFDEALVQYMDSWLSPEAVSAQSVSLTLPTFTLTSSASYQEILTMMGMNTVLRAQTARLSDMLDPALVLPTPVNDVFSVGSLAIGPNGINMRSADSAPAASAPSEESVEIVFDRPFLVAVTDTHTGALLQLGWVNQAGSGR